MNGGIQLFVTAGELRQEWARCGLTADWVADYLVLDLEQSLREVAKNLISTVANELLENAAKFSIDRRAAIEISARSDGSFVEIETRNQSSEERAKLLYPSGQQRRDLGALAGAESRAWKSERERA